MSANSEQKKPKAYVDGYRYFYDLDFLVTPDVLIPRPETESVVSEILIMSGQPCLPGVIVSEPRRIPPTAKILDVGTGSGCIAATLAQMDFEVTATDISLEALRIAKRNALKFLSPVKFIQSDLLENVSGNFDVIVANLPYVDKNWPWLDLEALSYEPEIALFAEDGGCELILKLIKQAKGRCKFLVLEADPSQHKRIRDHAKEYGFKHEKTRGYALVFSS